MPKIGITSTYVGEIKTNKYGTYKVLEIKNAVNILIEWQDEFKHQMIRTGDEIKKNTPKNPYAKSYFGVGFIGVGKYSWSDRKEHLLWKSMLERCYSEKKQFVQSSYYLKVAVQEEWQNFQVFAEWCNNQENFRIKGMELDKDLLIKGNKLYGPEYCCFIPDELNNLLLLNKSNRGKYPIGVHFCKMRRKLISTMKSGDRRPKLLGVFDNVNDAFSAYKEAKEARIKSLAEKWKPLISSSAYRALINYSVDIDD